MHSCAHRLGLMTLVASVITIRGANAEVITFTDRAQWQAATISMTNIDFDGIAPSGRAVDFSTSVGLRSNGVTFIGVTTSTSCTLSGCSPTITTNSLLVADASVSPQYSWASGGLLVGPFAYLSCASPGSGCTSVTGQIQIVLPPGTTSFGADFSHTNGANSQWPPPTVTLPTGESFVAPPGFWGLTTTNPISGPIIIDTPLGFGPSPNQAFIDNFSTGFVRPPSFTDDPLVSGGTAVKAVHILELRSRVAALRLRYGLAPVTWTDSTLAGVETKGAHVLELRLALQAVYQSAARTPPLFTDLALIAAQTIIRAVHITELRAAILAIE